MQTIRFTQFRGITLAVLTLLAGQGLLFGDDNGDTSPKCTKATLKGRYLFGATVTLLPPIPGAPALLAVAGYHIFNGDGTGTDIVTSTINGEIVENNGHFTITYTVNSDCTGTYTVPARGLSFNIFIAPGGEELIFIATTPGFVSVQGPNRRVSDK